MVMILEKKSVEQIWYVYLFCLVKAFEKDLKGTLQLQQNEGHWLQGK